MSDQRAAPNDQPERIVDMLRIGLEARKPVLGGSGDPGAAGPEATPLKPGVEIDGYQILKEIGQGGMGIVYKAKELALDRVVALKVLKPWVVSDATAAKQFQREATLAAQVSHPHVVKIFAIDKNWPPRYFAMELVQGLSLDTKIAREGALEPHHAVRIAMDVCKALIACHKEGVLHKDVHPGNILLENNIEFVKVTDFGIAQDLDAPLDASTAGTTAGTPDFMSPERKYLRKLDERTDVFSLGMTLYFMLTGAPAKQLGPAFLFTQQEYLPPSIVSKHIEEALDQVVLRMICPDPRHRYKDCEVVLRELERIRSPQRWHVSVKAALTAAACLAIGALGILLYRAYFPGQSGLPSTPRDVAVVDPHHVTFEGPALTAFGSNGQPIWSVSIESRVERAIVSTLFADEPPFVIAGAGATGRDAGKIMLYDHQGHLVRSAPTAEPYPFRGDADNIMMVQDIFAADLWQEGVPHILAIAKDAGKYPSKVFILNRDGEVKKSPSGEKKVYWHPGQLAGVLAFKPSNGERLRVLAWGLNNDMRSGIPGSKDGVNYGAIVCLDPETMSGEAPPRYGSIGKGTELWYGVVLPQGIGITGVKIRPAAVGAAEGTKGQTIQLSLDSGCFLHLDENGRLLWRSEGDRYSGPGDERVELIHEP